MQAERDRLALRALALFAAAVMSLGAVACGSDDGDGDGATADAAVAQSPDERDVRATLEEMSRAMTARDFEAVCDVVTPKVREDATTWEGYATCEKGMADALTDDPTGKANVVNADMPSITKVAVDGDTALVSAKRGQKKLIARVKKQPDGTWLMERWFSDD